MLLLPLPPRASACFCCWDSTRPSPLLIAPQSHALAQEAPAEILRDPEEQREYDAQVEAIRTEIDSTYIHQAVLEKRRSMLENRLISMGVA